MRRKAPAMSIFLVVITITACATAEVLLPRSGEVPPGMDFSGRWELRDPDRESIRRLDDATAGIPHDILKESKRTSNDKSSKASQGTAVYVFLEAGINLKITQTEFAIFVSFDRSIVEEYRFGENRVVRVGPIGAARVSGWDGNEYVIETLDEDGAKLTERYRLEDNDSRLVRRIVLRVKKEQTLDIEQIYVRIQ